MKKLLVAIALVLASLGLYGVGTAGATPVPCNFTGSGGWWVHSYNGAGTVVNCSVDGNHVKVDYYYGGVYQGVAFDGWIPGWVRMGAMPSAGQGSYNGFLHFCPPTYLGPPTVRRAWGPPGWMHAFGWDGDQNGSWEWAEGAFNAWGPYDYLQTNINQKVRQTTCYATDALVIGGN